MTAGLDPVPGRLDHRQPDARLADEPGEQPDRVRTAADAGDCKIGQAALDGEQLSGCLVTDPPLQVAHDRRIGMRPHGRAQDVVRRLDVRHPVAHRLVDGVLERRGARRDGADLRAQRTHPQHVRALPLDVLGAHVHDARQVEQGAGRGGRDAVLTRARLGDDPGLAKPPGQQGLPERVVDLVRAGVGEVFALEVEPDRWQGASERRPTAGAKPAASRPTAVASRSAR